MAAVFGVGLPGTQITGVREELVGCVDPHEVGRMEEGKGWGGFSLLNSFLHTGFRTETLGPALPISLSLRADCWGNEAAVECPCS